VNARIVPIVGMLFVIVLSLSIACANQYDRIVVTPSGDYAYAVSCARLDRCYIRATRDCPNGYVRLDTSGNAPDSTLTSNEGTTPSEGKHLWLVQCNVPPSPHP
jgi:hypothetical protein